MGHLYHGYVSHNQMVDSKRSTNGLFSGYSATIHPHPLEIQLNHNPWDEPPTQRTTNTKFPRNFMRPETQAIFPGPPSPHLHHRPVTQDLQPMAGRKKRCWQCGVITQGYPRNSRDIVGIWTNSQIFGANICWTSPKKKHHLRMPSSAVYPSKRLHNYNTS